jgi:ParB-like chromosome segregation protein Spo0J
MSKASWIYQDVPLSKIIDHPVNSAIYGDNFDDALVESIKQTEGVIEPVHLVKHDGGSFVCLSGHRRRQATAIAGFTTIAAMVFRGEMTAAEQVIHVIEANRKREKTVEQKARETEKLSIALKDVAAERRKRKPVNSVPKNVTEQNSEDKTERESIVKAAKETGIGSRPTAEKAIEVVHAIDAATEAGDTETAEELRETLNKKSVSAAHAKATGKPAKEKPAKATKSNSGPFADLVAGIEWALTQVVPRSQEIALRASQLLGKRAGLFDVDAVKAAVGVLATVTVSETVAVAPSKRVTTPEIIWPICSSNSSWIESRSASRIFWMMTCLAVWAPIRPESSWVSITTPSRVPESRPSSRSITIWMSEVSPNCLVNAVTSADSIA